MPCATNAQSDVVTDRAKTGRLKRSTGSSGIASEFCRRTRTYPTSRAPASSLNTSRAAWWWPMPLIPLIRKAKAIALKAALAKSKRWSVGGVVGSRRHDIASATSDRDIYREEPGPRRDREDRRSDARAGGRRYRHDDRNHRDAAAQLAARISEAHQSGVDAHHAGGAEPLQRAAERQHRQ